MRISNWSSDVCSSDLGRRAVTGGHAAIAAQVGAAGFELLQRRRSGVESSSSAEGVGMPLTDDLAFLPVTRPATRFRRLPLREPPRRARLYSRAEQQSLLCPRSAGTRQATIFSLTSPSYAH